MRPADEGLGPSLRRLTATAIGLGLVLLAIRVNLWYVSPGVREELRLAGGFTRAVYYDTVYVVGLTLVFALAMVAWAGQPRVRRILHAVYRAVALFSVLLGFMNIRAVAELGRPMSYQWLYYSHFFQSLDTYNALSTIVTWKWPLKALTVCAAMLLAELVAAFMLLRMTRAGSGRAALAGSACVLAGALALGRWSGHDGSDSTPIQNPVVALAGSAIHADDSPVLAHMPTPVGPEDFLTVAERSPRLATGGHVDGFPGTSHGVRDVVIVVMESVPAEYLGAYGATYGATPELDSLQAGSRRYTNIYAHAPSTTNSLLAILLSVYPWHTFRPVTRVHPDIALPSLSTELERQGYRTGFFNAEDNRFQRAGEFLDGRFDAVTDYRNFPCTEAERKREGSDHCAVKTFEKWLDSTRARPFLAVLWTAQTHFPYTSTRPVRVPPGSDSVATRFQRYLGGLRDSDRAVGDIFRLLEQRQLVDSTLVVVLGDHGEAFGQHGHELHRDLFEEEAHIPLLLINRRLFRGESDSLVAGMIDIAPTIMDLLGLPSAWSWQGRSLFDRAQTGRVYLFAPYSGLFGLREGDRKLILDDASRKPPQVYNLRADPGEKHNLARSAPEFVRAGRERLAAWVQYQDRFFERVFAATRR